MKKSALILSYLLFSASFLSNAQDSLSFYLETGKKLYQEESFVESMKLYEQAVKSYPRNYDLIMGLADSKHKLDMFEPAIELYNKAEEINDKDAELYFNRGAAYIFIQEYKDASKDLEESIKLRPDYDRVHYFLGYANAAMDKYEKAIENYTKAIELNPNYAEAYYNRGAAKAELDAYEAGMEDFKVALEKNPDLQNGQMNVALSMLGLKRYAEAIELFTNIIEQRDENLAKAYFYRGEAHYELDQKDLACSDWNKGANQGHEQAKEYARNFCKESSKKRKKKIDIVF